MAPPARPGGPLTRWLARPSALLLLAVGVAACALAFRWPGSPAASSHFIALTGLPPFDERTGGYTLADLQASLALLGPEGLRGYAAYRLVDVGFPWLLAGLVAALLQRLGAAALLPLPAVVAIVDSAENLLLGLALWCPATRSAALVGTASVLTQGKWALIALMLLALLGAGLRWQLRRRDLQPRR